MVTDPTKFISLRRLALTCPALWCTRVLTSPRPGLLAELKLRCRIHYGGALVATVTLDKVSTKFPRMEAVMQQDVIAALRAAAALNPAKLALAIGPFASADAKAAVEAVARELGAA